MARPRSPKARMIAAWALLGCLFLIPNTRAADAPASAPKDEMLLFEEIPTVYAASKYEQKVTEAPSYASIVTGAEIRAQGYHTLADVLMGQQGFYVTNDRNYSYVGVRGFAPPGDYNTRILVLIDGHRINDTVYDMAPIGTDFPLDLALVDRIEIVRGPSSCLYGSNAFFAVVNVITRTGASQKETELAGEAGDHGTYRGRFTAGRQFSDGLSALVSATRYHSDGEDLHFREFDTPATQDGWARGLDGDASSDFWTALSLHDFCLRGAFGQRDKTIPTASYGTLFGDPGSKTRDIYSFTDLSYQPAPRGPLQWSGRLYYDWDDYTGTYAYQDSVVDSVPPFRYLDKDIGKTGRWGLEGRLIRDLGSAHRFTAGAEYRDDFLIEQQNYNFLPYQLFLNDRSEGQVWGVYAEDAFTLRPGLVLYAGGRHDQDQSFGGTTNPRLALVYNPDPRTDAKLIFGRSFRAPNAYELYYDDHATQEGNSSLRPETILTGEFDLGRLVQRHLHAQLSVFTYQIHDLIREQMDAADSMIIYRNSDRIRSSGCEVELATRRCKLLDGRIGYSFQISKDNLTGQTLVNSPRHMVKVEVRLPEEEKRWQAGANVQYMSARRTLQGQTDGAQAVANVTLEYRLPWRNLSASAGVYNLFDERLGDPGGEELTEDLLPRVGRSFLLGLQLAGNQKP